MYKVWFIFMHGKADFLVGITIKPASGNEQSPGHRGIQTLDLCILTELELLTVPPGKQKNRKNNDNKNNRGQEAELLILEKYDFSS